MPTRTDHYKVVINHEEQYSIIPADQTVTSGFRELGFKGDPDACLTYIEKVWTDMQPSDKKRILKSLGR